MNEVVQKFKIKHVFWFFAQINGQRTCSTCVNWFRKVSGWCLLATKTWTRIKLCDTWCTRAKVRGKDVTPVWNVPSLNVQILKLFCSVCRSYNCSKLPPWNRYWFALTPPFEPGVPQFNTYFIRPYFKRVFNACYI